MEENKQDSDEVECEYCAEKIKAKAKKCKHCGEMVDSRTGESTSSGGASNSKSQDGKIESDKQKFDFDKIKKVAGILLLCAIVGIAIEKSIGGAFSGGGSSKDAQDAGANEQKVTDCIYSVRRAWVVSHWGGDDMISSFDARITSDGSVSYIGTAEERFSFEKCMDENGDALN
ncbi:MAG: hypothetical protein V1911_04365 [Candidatus Micrarchaeota archaeon]